MALTYDSAATFDDPSFTWDGELIPPTPSGPRIRWPGVYFQTKPPGGNLSDPLGVVSHLAH